MKSTGGVQYNEDKNSLLTTSLSSKPHLVEFVSSGVSFSWKEIAIINLQLDFGLMRPPATDMVLRNDFNRFFKRTMSQVPELDLSRKEYAVQLKVDEETEGYDKEVAESHCKKFIEDAFKRNRKRMDFHMTNKGFYTFSCYLSNYQFRVLKGKSEVKSIVPIPRRVLEIECD